MNVDDHVGSYKNVAEMEYIALFHLFIFFFLRRLRIIELTIAR